MIQEEDSYDNDDTWIITVIAIGIIFSGSSIIIMFIIIATRNQNHDDLHKANQEHREATATAWQELHVAEWC